MLPPSSGPGRPKDPAKRDAILEAAKTLFLRNGYDGSSMDAIAAEAGVSKLTVYSHFTDKENLFSAAVKAKCEEQVPGLFFALPEGARIENVLLNIARGFHVLINSCESVELHRVMVSQGSQSPKLSRMFYEAGPQRLLDGMEHLLAQATAAGQLDIDDVPTAADQFFCLVKGGANFRLLVGCGEPLQGEDAEQHIEASVSMFMRAYGPR
ncbi:TetR/AcrR family transcriptional regulator [Pseudomonas sp. GD03944]|uniref:TetR/AcrR family transcriptional regulator n=1 Tax=Pseudomonas sp. GD03944 TaxID=2975409 RepID=UPI002446A16B|nr:TetR/AcrR family transcriptional regulator [Pseudomonas sp. GD03944]MDH1264300.1 TetR/AcrR family transcriptional regulator [Pseudomonas sp. GD03944]HWV09920.1 TetR/AcrR family transcriptional regulator [Pseudomonas sp.]